jgi:hypothetical protein
MQILTETGKVPLCYRWFDFSRKRFWKFTNNFVFKMLFLWLATDSVIDQIFNRTDGWSKKRRSQKSIQFSTFHSCIRFLIKLCMCQLETSHCRRYWFSVSVATVNFTMIGCCRWMLLSRQCFPDQHPIANERNEGSYLEWLQPQSALMYLLTFSQAISSGINSSLAKHSLHYYVVVKESNNWKPDLQFFKRCCL